MATIANENIIGDADGRPNLILYFGPDLDLDGASSPVNASNTYRITRWADDGSEEYYTPGGGSNDFHTLDAGYMGVYGRGYLIVAKASFVLEHAAPGEQVVEVS